MCGRCGVMQERRDGRAIRIGCKRGAMKQKQEQGAPAVG